MKLDNPTVGAVIRTLRLQRNMTLEMLSGFADIVRSHLSMFENGTKQPNLETLWRIAGALEMNPANWFAKLKKTISNRESSAVFLAGLS